MRKFFKYSESVKIKNKKNKSDFLKRESVEYCSIVNVEDDGIIFTKNKVRGKIYQFTFKIPVGLSPEIDRMNKQRLTQLISSCNGKMKFWLLNEQKNMLNENMELLKERANEISDEGLLDVCVNRYTIMQTLEKLSYVTFYVFVEDSIYKFEELSESFLNIYQLEGDILLDFIERINNDPCGGDMFVFE